MDRMFAYKFYKTYILRIKVIVLHPGVNILILFE